MDDKINSREVTGLDSFLNKQAEKQIATYVSQYATKPDGTTDEGLANRIRWEVGRRAETGKMLDIYEPLRWTGIRAVLGVLGAGTAKMITDRTTGKSKNLFFGVELGLLISTAINSAIDLTRLYPRWLSGLEGGKNTALKLHREFDAPSSEQDFSAPPAVTPEREKNSRSIAKKPPVEPTPLLQQAERSEMTRQIS